MNDTLENIMKILKELLGYQTTEAQTEEFEKILTYIKGIMPKELMIKEYLFQGKKSLVITNTEETELDIVFCTHVDIVPAQNYNWIEDDINIYGRGTFDMKGSVAVCLELFKNLNTNKKVGLFITTDEEITGNCAKQLLNIYQPKFAIVPDGGKNLQVVQEEKGQLQLKISIKTKSAHASQPYNGENAIVELMNIYSLLLEKYPLPKSGDDYKTSINLSMIKGGNALNSVPDEAEMYLDIRHVSVDKKEDFIHTIEILNPKLDIEMIHSGSVFQTDLNHPFVKKYIAVAKSVQNKDVEIVSSEATSDAIYFSDKHIPTILTNPTGDYAHSSKEYVKKESLYQLYQIWEKVLKEEF